MFGLLKPRMTPKELARTFATGTFAIASSNESRKFERAKREFISEGADPGSLTLELAAFHSCCVWAGAARALQRGKITALKFESLMSEHVLQLQILASETLVEQESVKTLGASFADLVEARMATLVSIAVDVAPEAVLATIVKTFSNYLTTGEPTLRLKSLVQHNYLLSEGSAYDRVAGTRLT